MDIDASAARREVADPTTSPGRLAELAQSFAELRVHIAAHPAAYPELVAWISEQSPEPIDASIPGESNLDTPVPMMGETPPETSSSRVQRIGWVQVAVSAGVGAAVGSGLSIVLVIWVLPGLFGAA